MLKKSKTQVNVSNLLREIELPKKNESIFHIEQNNINLFDYFNFISKTQEIEDVTLLSYRISRKDITLMEQIRKRDNLKKINLILSTSIKSMVVGVYRYLNDNENFNTKYIVTHEKVLMVKTKTDSYVVISSSNFNPKRWIENIEIINNEYLYKEYLNNGKEKGKEEGRRA